MAKKNKQTTVDISCPKCGHPLLSLGNLVDPAKVTIQCPCGYTLKTKDITGDKLCGGTSK